MTASAPGVSDWASIVWSVNKYWKSPSFCLARSWLSATSYSSVICATFSDSKLVFSLEERVIEPMDCPARLSIKVSAMNIRSSTMMEVTPRLWKALWDGLARLPAVSALPEPIWSEAI